jgi:hypothetical protein
VLHAVPDDAQPQRRRRLAETDQLAIGTRARREPLCADVERLEQVRLARTVLADDEDDPG